MDWQSVSRQVDIELNCECTSRVLTVFEASNGTKHYRMQCVRCGEFKTVRKSDYTESQLKSCPPFNDALRSAWFDRKAGRRRELTEQMQGEESSKWWQRYSRYLVSPEWLDKRQRVLERDAHRCKACERRDATEVHHLSYKHVFHEPLFELISVCKICHAALTRYDKEA